MTPQHMALGVVAIGRNEGDRLKACLRSLVGRADTIVYVDSGSTDGSPDFARSLGVDVVELDMSTLFTAARARNEGLARLKELGAIDLVQFIDGDCEVFDGWIEHAVRSMSQRTDAAAVAGRLRERYPERTIYNRLCDVEWNTPVGEVRACGGIAMMRIKAIDAVGEFNRQMIAGEEPELCFRMRQAGWKILRLDCDMAWHDADMTRFGQWWRRSKRNGHSCIERSWLHGRSPERYMVKETRSPWLWSVFVPAATLLLLWPTEGFSIAIIAAYPLLLFRIYARSRKRGLTREESLIFAASCTFGKLPELLGQLQFLRNRIIGRRSKIIEYK